MRLPVKTQKIHASQYIDTTFCKPQLGFVKTDTTYKIYKCTVTNDSIAVLKYAKRIIGINIYNSNQKSEYGFEYYSNGRLYRNYHKYSDTIVKDLYYYNDKFTSIKVERTFANGVLNGMSFTYYDLNDFQEDQKLKSKVNYVDGFLDGEATFYRKNGTIKEIAYYASGEYLKSYLYDAHGKFTGCVGCVLPDQ